MIDRSILYFTKFKIENSPIVIYRFNTICIKSTERYNTGIDDLILKFV